MKAPDAGFTLIEALISLIITVVVSVLFFQLVVNGLQTTAAASRHDAALQIAKSRLAEAGLSRPLETGIQKGKAKRGMTWQLSIRPYATPRGTTTDTFWVTAKVMWKDLQRAKTQSVELTTIKLKAHP